MNKQKSSNQKGFAHIALIIAAALFTGGTGTVVASNGSKPGDTLYGIDRAAEKIQLALSLTSGMKQARHRELAKERVFELQKLLDDGSANPGDIGRLMSDFLKEKSKIVDLIGDDKNKAKQVDDEFEALEKNIDKLFENRQKSLETQREQLKKDYEAALKAGDTARAQELLARINSFESLLKSLENERESNKQQLEEQEKELESSQSEDTQHQEEVEREAEKKAAEEQSEAEKKAAEAAREAEKQAAESH